MLPKSRFIILSSLLLMTQVAFAQTTTRWQTTHQGNSQGECQLESNIIRMTVHPFHMDIEEEASIATRGTVGWGDPATLEIFGEFVLTKGAIIRSMLLWNGDKILKAKLKSKAQADSAYEEVVDRDKPRPIVRDPALIEYLGDNRYRFKIYPVRINEARRIRVLYTVPLSVNHGQPAFLVQTAFTNGPQQRVSMIPVEFRAAGTVSGSCVLSYGSTNRTVEFGAVYKLPVEAFGVRQYYWQEPISTPFTVVPDFLSEQRVWAAQIDTGSHSGHYAAIFTPVPSQVLAARSELALGPSSTIEAMVAAGDKKYITDLQAKAFTGIYLKSNSAWDGKVRWRLFDNHGKAVFEFDQQLQEENDTSSARMLPTIWAAKYSLMQELGSLGAVFGFVDRNMSLLALESDVLSSTEAQKYSENGVPILTPQEIIVSSELPRLPQENIIFERGTAVLMVRLHELNGFDVSILTGNLLRLHLGTLGGVTVNFVLLDAAGRVVHTWNSVKVTGSSVDLRVPSEIKGTFILKMTLNKKNFHKQIVLH